LWSCDGERAVEKDSLTGALDDEHAVVQ